MLRELLLFLRFKLSEAMEFPSETEVHYAALWPRVDNRKLDSKQMMLKMGRVLILDLSPHNSLPLFLFVGQINCLPSFIRLQGR